MKGDDILKVQQQWEHSTKDAILDNLEGYLIARYPDCENFNTKIKTLMALSGDKHDTVFAWVNRSRKKVKIPFLKLCKISAELGVDIEDMLH